jgi:hypothetical protein
MSIILNQSQELSLKMLEFHYLNARKGNLFKLKGNVSFYMSGSHYRPFLRAKRISHKRMGSIPFALFASSSKADTENAGSNSAKAAFLNESLIPSSLD